MKVALILHLLAACIWVGGHLYLSVCLLPSIMKNRDVVQLLSFEKSYEWLGMSALLLQIITGLYMALQILPFGMWFNHAGGVVSSLICIKLTWLFLTAAIALNARFRVIPNISERTLPLMVVHILGITILGIAFLLTGAWFRFG